MAVDFNKRDLELFPQKLMHENPSRSRLLSKRSGLPTAILLLLAIAMLPGFSRSAQAATPNSPLALDGAGAGGCPNTTMSCSATLSTQHSDDIIIAFTWEALTIQPPCSFTISDTAGLPWATRSGIAFEITGRGELQEFWARSINPISSDSITESISGCGDAYNGLMVFGISGANFDIPFDPKSSLPSNSLGTSGDTSVLVSTNNPDDMVYAAVVHGGVTGSLTPEQGFTLVPQSSSTVAVEYSVANSTLTNSSVTFGDPFTDNWMSIGDAVQVMSTSPDFFVNASPQSLTIKPGFNGNSTITLSSFNDFTGTISLNATVSPNTIAKPSAAVNPTSVPLSSNGTSISILTISTSGSTLPGSYLVTVAGSNGTLTRSVSVSVLVPSPDFSITASNSSLFVQAGFSVNDTIIVTSLTGFSGNVTLSTSSFGPGNLTVVILPSMVMLAANANVTAVLTVIAGFPFYTPASFTVTVTGTNGAISHSAGILVTVLPPPPPPPDFGLNVFPPSLTIVAGEAQTVGVYVVSINGFFQNVTLKATVSPQVSNGPVVSLSPSVVRPFSSAILTVSTTALTTVGNYTVTITGTSGNQNHSVTVLVQILPPPTLTLTPSSGPIGTKVLVKGTGFPVQYGQTEILLTFDDQLLGFTFTSNGSFNFTFNVPVSQPSFHLVKATEPSFTSNGLIVVSAPFQVLSNPVSPSVSLTVGTIYFPGDTALINVLVTESGVPLSSSSLQLTVTLTTPNNSHVVLSTTSLGSGLFKASYAIPKNASIGTYSLVASAHLPSVGDGSALGSFEVKLPWLSSQAQSTATVAGIASIAMVGVSLFSWRKGYFRKPSKETQAAI